MTGMTPWFLTEFFNTHKGFKNMLEVGCRDVSQIDNIENIRQFIPQECKYTGIDMIGGKNVDLVLNGHDLLEHFGPDRFDLIVCFDTFEHDDKFWETWDNMVKVLKPLGYIVLGAPSRRTPLHEHPNDYWRFMEPSFRDIFFKDFQDVYIKVFYPIESNDNEIENAIYGWGQKR